MPFVYSSDALSALDQTISTERLANYVVMAQGDRLKALQLYERNTLLCEGFYGILQALEVSVRNSIHKIISQNVGRNNWFDAPTFLDTKELDLIQDAKNNILRNSKTVVAGRVISELTFGFWIRLMTATYEKTAWIPHISRAFPHLHRPNRTAVFTRFREIRDLRNRVAHHERIIHNDYRRDYQKAIECIEWVCPVTARWVNSRNSLNRALLR